MKTKIWSIFGLVAFVIAPLFARADIDLEAIQPEGFARGVSFTVAGYDASRSPLTNFPVLVRLSTAITNTFYAECLLPDGEDICFKAADGAPLAFDIDTWNPSGESLVWVTLPTMTNGAEFALFYRSSKSGKTVCADNAFSKFVGVWHLGETGDGQQAIKDATTNNLQASSSTRSLAKSDGVVGGARQITNRRAKGDPALVVNKDDAVIAKLNTLGTNFTFSAWMRPYGSIDNTDSATELSTTAGIGYDVLFSRKNSVSTKAWGVQLMNNPNSMRVFTSQNANPNETGGKLDFKQNQWGRFDIVYDSTLTAKKTNVSIYWNGERVYGPSQYDLVKQGSETLDIGGFTGGERPFYGAMDEVRVGPFLPSPDWIKADYDQATNAAYLSAGAVVAFAEIPKPVATFSLLDSGAAFAQLGGTITALGEGANSADVYYKVWPVGGNEPGEWTPLASGLEVGDSFEGIVTNLTPQVAYTNLLKAVNNLETPYDSDIATLPFTTSGAGEAGTGGNAKRVGDSIVHTFTVDPNEGDIWEFVPPSYAESVETLVVGGGGPGGYYAGGGGGAGGLVYNAALAVQGGMTYTVKVGAGGTASSGVAIYGTNGGDSLITSGSGAVTNAIAYGGGAGGNGNLGGQTATCPGIAGGSGGGASSGNSYAAGSATPSGQGNAGGGGFTSGNPKGVWGGGGGGAGGSGGTVAQGNTIPAGAGGNGIAYLISGTETYYAGGGGGGGTLNGNENAYGAGGAGGSGIGGTGGMRTPVDESAKQASAGRDGTGSGGGGGSTVEGSYGGANGGSGIVIVRYPIQGDGTAMPNPAIALTSATHDKESNVVSFTYRVAWAGYGYQVADVGIAWGYSPSALTTTNTVVTDKIGSGSGTVQLPNVSKTVYLRAVATNKGGKVDDSVETALFTLFNPDAPVGTISVTDTGYTNAVFSVDVTNFGKDASSASVTVEVCASADFTGTVLSFPATEDLSLVGTVSVPATGLAQNTAYYARAIVVNSEDVELTTDAIEFSTLQPGAPVGTAAETDIGLTTLSASVRVTNFGTGSDSATVRLEVSTASDFSTLAAVSEETAAALNTTLPLTASGLSPDTTYYRRVRIRNWWGVDTYVALSATSTRSVPFSAAGPSWTASGDTVDLSLAVSAVYDHAECTAVLTYGGEEVVTQTFNAAGTITWSGLAAKADGAVAQIVVTTTVNGTDYVLTFSAPVTPGASATAVTDISTYCSADGALWMRPGDTAMLPDLFGDASYQVLNERFAKIEGSTLTALEPGIVGIRCVDASHNTTIMGVVVLPDAIGEGSVYVFDETKWTDDSWTKAASWKKVDGATRTAAASNDSWPCHADDIAILPFYNRAGDQYIRHRDHITLGGLYAGMIRPDASVNCHLERFKDVDTKTVTFRRTDGQPVDVKTCPSSESDNYSRIVLGSYDIDVVWASDAVIDGCSSETDVNGPRGRFYVKTGGSTNTLQNVTLTFQGYPGYQINGYGCTDTIKGVWRGSGTIVKKGFGGIAFDGDFSDFSGTIREVTGPSPGNLKDNAAGLLMRAAGASNIVAHVYGYAAYKRDTGAIEFNTLSRGLLGTGGANATPDKGAQGPAKGLHMHGGSFKAYSNGDESWGVGVADEKSFDVLSVGAGFSYITLQNGPGNQSSKPINAVKAWTLAQTDKGTLALYEPSLNNNARQTVTNNMFSVLDWADHAVGGTGNGENGASGATDDFAIVPWIIANGDGNYSYLAFPAVDANGRLVKPVRTATHIDQVSGENANAICSDGYGSLTRGTAKNIVVNSLFLNNSSKGDKWLGADRTLTIKSGGLIFHSNGSAIGLPGRDDNGKLVLGDASHPAYVWNKAFGNYTNQIWAAVTAAGGFVSTYTGNLELGGDQTGIANEIVVNGGTLALGSAEYEIELADNLPIRVCAGAKLILPSRNAVAKSPVKIDGSAEAFGKVELPVNQTCASLAVRDVYESNEWTTLPEGTYGSSESNAEFVRDDLFVGPGVLTVGEAKTRGVMFLIY